MSIVKPDPVLPLITSPVNSRIGTRQNESIGITLIRQKSKSRDISSGKKLLSLVAKEYGYKGKEIAEYIQKVIKTLRDERTNVNSQV